MALSVLGHLLSTEWANKQTAYKGLQRVHMMTQICPITELFSS